MRIFKLLLVATIIVAGYALQAQVAISTTGNDPDASAMLDVQTTTKGFLPPRMTKEQMEAIADPAEGLMVYCTDCSPKTPYYYNGTNFVSVTTALPSGMSMSSTDVYNPKTGEIWMDRNLGASRVATSSTDYLAYGSLYQWGRGSDGHEVINWTTSTTSDGAEQANETNIQSTTDTPGNNKFIIGYSDWRSTQTDYLWQGINGVNNPCPTGYRLPTEAELNAERQSWSSNEAAGAYASPLKLLVAGVRFFSSGTLDDMGSSGYYWSSTVTGGSSRVLFFSGSNAFMTNGARAGGVSVRCIKD